MFPLSSAMRAGSVVEQFGRALVPGAQPRPSQPAPDHRKSGWASAYESRGGLDVFAVDRTLREAQIANGRAREAQREARQLGRAVGGTLMLAIGLWLGRRK